VLAALHQLLQLSYFALFVCSLIAIAHSDFEVTFFQSDFALFICSVVFADSGFEVGGSVKMILHLIVELILHF